jgi:hypothetical protein
MDTKELRARRMSLYTEGKSIHELADKEGRQLGA